MDKQSSTGSIKTQRTLKVRRKIAPLQVPQVARPLKQAKTVKVMKRLIGIRNQDQAKKYEKYQKYDSNPSSFLQSKDISPSKLSIGNSHLKYSDDGELIRHHVVGPLSLFKRRKQMTETATPSSIRYSRTGSFLKAKQQNQQLKYSQKMNQIHAGIYQENQQELNKLDSMVFSDQLTYQRQQKSLENHQKITEFWDDFETKVSQRLKRPKENLAVSRSEFFRERIEDENKTEAQQTPDEKMGNSAWYMSLRSGYNNKNLKSAFFHIGNELSGLYCYVKQRNYKQDAKIKRPGSLQASLRSYRSDPYFQSKRYMKKSQIDFDNLYVSGYSKLPMEQESLRSVGIQYYNPNLIARGEEADSIIAENYDRKRINMLLGRKSTKIN